MMKHMVQGKSIVRNIYIMLMVVTIWGTSPIFAQDVQERSWSLELGFGANINPVYPGSDELEMMPFPYIDAATRQPILTSLLQVMEPDSN